jgi:uncharacterized protein
VRRFGLSFLFILLGIAASAAALHFPALTGRVVDDAHMLPLQAIEALEQKLADYEQGTGNQFVVVTLPSLQGDSIDDYGYQLGRTWKIGQKDKNNGVLLIIVPSEHKVRMEVGYGLEPLLTDAASSEIINGIILPAFRAGDMERGVVEGTQAILNVLGGNSAHANNNGQAPPLSQPVNWLALLGIIFILCLSMRYPIFAGLMLNIGMDILRSSGSSSGGSGWSGGGGGSFGGGGASGSW